MFFSSSTKKGFTIIEMLVVLVIISITSSVVIVSLSSSRSARQTERTAHTLAGSLREAQNYALTGRSDSISQENCYFGIRFISTTQYTLVNYYRSGGNCNSYNTVNTTTLPTGTTITGISTFPTVLAFSLPRAEVYTATTGNLASMGTAQLIGVTKSGQSQYVCLYPTGRVEERGTTASCP